MSAQLLNEGDGWRCGACGYFHRADVLYEKPPARCENCEIELSGVDPQSNPFAWPPAENP